MPIARRSREAVYLRAGPVGCLVLHGFGGSPAEVRPLVEGLAARGITVCAPVLPGHGPDAANLGRTRLRHWIRGAEGALRELQAACAEVHVAGFSLGGLIALHLAARHPVSSVCTLAAPILAEDPGAIGARLSAYLGDPAAAMPALRSLVRLARLARRDLGRVRAPVLVLQGDRDDWIAPESGQYLAERLSSARLVVLPGRGHFLALERGREEVAVRIAQWITARSEPK
ncbi:alpha/beta hydrolase [Symbiobacterium thermophilum]|uniref:Putative esterase n=1 Tax=Symbiobacterium thermophilum (strain DSM 24528 / JCM 14929 / IAM 14863 / T) TaxID=292459 RepID=Q67SV7_SYMTH|nr:alpha/beta fold hydrolase [Symbiobacterium thermophilum]BAD39236.1 putative esterase [Symbiobacterium thermophilum IAM 14863]